MTRQIIWRYFKKRHRYPAANTMKHDRSFSNSESMAAANVHPRQKQEKEEVPRATLQFQEEEEKQDKVQFQEEEEQEKPQLKSIQQNRPKSVRSRSSRLIRKVVKSGFRGGPGSYPYMNRIQGSFGRYNISNVQSFNDAAAKQANCKLGALAYASRNKVAFRGYPDLHTAAHEAAHIIQQRKGVDLDGGMGKIGDRYERHADAVADRVVHGKSAENLLGTVNRYK